MKDNSDSNVKVIARGLIVNGKVYYKIEDKSAIDNNCKNCDLIEECRLNRIIKVYCSGIYINGSFKIQDSLPDNKSAINHVEINFNGTNLITKWDPRYDGCKSCIIYKKYIDPEVTGFSEDDGKVKSCYMLINNGLNRIKDFCNPEENEVYQFKQEVRFG